MIRSSRSLALPCLLLILTGQVRAADPPNGGIQELPAIVVTGALPLPGLGLPLRDIAGNLQSVRGMDIGRQHAGNITEYLEQNLGSVTVNAAQGNPYQPDVSYRGFTASPLLGTPQGLSVFQDGVRINEPFGDVVNWDLLPLAAIAGLQVIPGSNPVFGLNTLGGAIAISTKSGSSHPGGQLELSGGSFGRKTWELEHGGRAGKLDYFVTANDSAERGWAEHNPSLVRQLFGKIGYRISDTRVELSLTAANNDLHGAQTIPRSFLDNPRQAYTFPDENQNQASLWSLSGSHFFSETVQLSGNAYYRNYSNRNLSSNVNGDVNSAIEASNARAAVLQDSYGMSLQLSRLGRLAAMDNQLAIGISGDLAQASFTQFSQDAQFTARRDTVGIAPYALVTDARTVNSNLGLFFSDTLSWNPRWSGTVSARYNLARVSMADQTGLQALLNGTHEFSRINPGLGLSYHPHPGLTAYGGYNQGMRTPTAIELACADPNAPCSLPNAFIADPPLKPVIAKTAEFGARGKLGATSNWSAAMFRTTLADDLQFISSSGAASSTGYFQNVGATRRQGLEFSARTVRDKLAATLSYSHIEARYLTAYRERSASNSSADGNGDIQVLPGNRMPGLPQNSLKLRLDYTATPDWDIAASLLLRSAIYARGDENNQDRNGTVAGYFLVNLDAIYTLAKNLQLFARVDNLFNRQYANFAVLGQNYFNGPGHTFDGGNILTEQFVAPGAPRGAWLGLRYLWYK